VKLDLRHGPMRLDVAQRTLEGRRSSDKSRKGGLDIVVLMDIGWHVGSPCGSIHQLTLDPPLAYARRTECDHELLRTQEETARTIRPCV